jgi:transposase, IS5 family
VFAFLVDDGASIIVAPPTRRAIPKCIRPRRETSGISGMKAHFGVDSRTKLIHAVGATPANVAESTVLPDLLHGQETRVWGDQAYRSQRAVIREQAPKAGFRQSPLPSPLGRG